MALTFVNGGEKATLEYLVNKVTSQEDLVLHLFTNDITPSETDTVGSYTEASFTGYSSVTLTGASWGAVTEGDPSSIS